VAKITQIARENEFSFMVILYKVLQIIKFASNNDNSKKNMFGDVMGMMGKLKETQEKLEATKKRLDTVWIDEKSQDGLIQITVTANREIKSIHINESLLKDKEQLEDYLILTLNKAMQKATVIHEAELAAVAKEGMPNIPGLDLFK
jgi:DNA-binding YbaB/EbfC family protein